MQFKPFHSCLRQRALLKLPLAMLLLLCSVSQAWAVITILPTGSPRQLIMRVGSADNTVNKVTFDVLNANVSPSPTPVVGVPGSGAPATSPAGGVEVFMQTRNAATATTMFLNVDSSAGLSCIAGSGCGSTIIPFNTISWVSYNQDTTYPGLDIQNGSFNGSSSQQLIGVTATGVSVRFSNVLVFTYNNATLYPAGQYLGRVTYTGSMP
jgi:hypothetical protein